MESKSYEAYQLVLRKCKLIFPNLRPATIMTDYEMALKNAFYDVYPDAELHSCWFHYVQVIIIKLL